MPHELKTPNDKPEKLERIYASFIFATHQAALDFAGLVDEQDWAVSVRYAPERARWQAVVRREMLALHREVQDWQRKLSERAARVGGKADGWGKESHDA